MCKHGTASGPNTAGKCNENGNKTGLKAALGDEGAKKWPTISEQSSAYDKDSTEQISGEMTGLKTEEKGTVAGLFARTVEGAEVVEIRAITTTSVMINACYDLFSEGIGIVPYACVGVGGNFVGVVDGFVTPKLAYRVKAGLSYQLTPEISAFVGGYYHRIVGDGSYEDLPTKRLADDLSPAGRTKDTAVANFSMAYAGAELGVRFLF